MKSLYENVSLALLTDLYELTMAYGYWKTKRAEDTAVFHLFFRKPPFKGGYAIAAGLESVIYFLKNFRYQNSDLAYLATLKGENGSPLFEEEFLTYLADMRFSCDIDAVPEGEVVFPYEPLVRVQGPMLQAQLLESPLLTLINFPSLIATKAARICHAAKNDPVIEFGLRRAQGIDGAMSATRSAYIGGCVATSNVLGGKYYDIPVKGTHAHSWVMAFNSEPEAFEAYAEAMPHNCLFLVDTYDSIEGVRHAITAGKTLQSMGKKLLGIRLDSGDLAHLSIQARAMLDEAGFTDAKILASNELNEFLITDLKNQGAQIGVWGVGTHLVTAFGQPALDGVYKLSALKRQDKWEYKLKLSEQMTKISNPGILQVRRFSHNTEGYIGDALYDVFTDLSKGCHMVDPFDDTKKYFFQSQITAKDLLVPIFRGGDCVYKSPSLPDIQAYAKNELAQFDRSIRRFYNPHLYPVGMEKSLYEMKRQLVAKIRDIP